MLRARGGQQRPPTTTASGARGRAGGGGRKLAHLGHLHGRRYRLRFDAALLRRTSGRGCGGSQSGRVLGRDAVPRPRTAKKKHRRSVTQAGAASGALGRRRRMLPRLRAARPRSAVAATVCRFDHGFLDHRGMHTRDVVDDLKGEILNDLQILDQVLSFFQIHTIPLSAFLSFALGHEHSDHVPECFISRDPAAIAAAAKLLHFRDRKLARCCANVLAVPALLPGSTCVSCHGQRRRLSFTFPTRISHIFHQNLHLSVTIVLAPRDIFNGSVTDLTRIL